MVRPVLSVSEVSSSQMPEVSDLTPFYTSKVGLMGGDFKWMIIFTHGYPHTSTDRGRPGCLLQPEFLRGPLRPVCRSGPPSHGVLMEYYTPSWALYAHSGAIL